MIIVEGSQQVDEHIGLRQGWCTLQDRLHLVAGGCQPDMKMLGGKIYIGFLLSEQVCNAIRPQPVASIHNRNLATQGEFRQEQREIICGSVGGTGDDQFASLQGRKNVHPSKIRA